MNNPISQPDSRIRVRTRMRTPLMTNSTARMALLDRPAIRQTIER